MGGAETYLRDLLAEILATGEHHVLLVTGNVPPDAPLPEDPRCRRVSMASRGRRQVPVLAPVSGVLARARRLTGGSEEAALGEILRHERVDLWFCPFSDLRPRAPGTPSVVTVHDLQHEFHPEFFSA